MSAFKLHLFHVRDDSAASFAPVIEFPRYLITKYINSLRIVKIRNCISDCSDDGSLKCIKAVGTSFEAWPQVNFDPSLVSRPAAHRSQL